MNKFDIIAHNFCCQFVISSIINLSEWADEYAYLSPESAANPGKWLTLPYQREIMDVMTDSSVEMITWMKSSRVGYTKCINWLCGYHIHQDPCGIMIVQPTIEDAQGYSKDELAPMIRDTPVLTGLVSDPKSRDSNNTIMKKHFPGGQLLLTGANSARGFRRVSVRKVCFDEIDGYPPTAGLEGDQIKLGIRRTDYYWNRQILLGSTPTTKGISRIEQYYELSDKRRYYVPCPFCQHMQYLRWAQFDFSTKGTVDNPVYICESCHEAIEYKHQRRMVEGGEWRAEKPFNGHAGFHIWAAYSYSPNATWRHIVKEFLESKDDREKLKTWVNTVLGETWEEQGDSADLGEIIARAETIGGQIPPDAGILTAAVDVQDNRLEVLVKAWGRDEESWDISHHVIIGSPAMMKVWDDLDGILGNTYQHAAGHSLHISCAVVDTGGHFADQVYQFVKPRQVRRVFGIKGHAMSNRPIISRPTRDNKGKIDLFMVGTFAAKEIVLARINKEEPGPGYIHFSDNFDPEYFNQLTAEKKVTKYRKGFAYQEWIKVRPRNEAFDLQVYNLAALRIVCRTREDLNRIVAQITGQGGGISSAPRKRRVLSKGI